MQNLGFNALGRRVKLACTTLVLTSLLLFIVQISAPEAAQAQSCPPEWMSCTPWEAVGCCCCIFVFYEGTHYRRECTWWVYSVNNYPTCIFKVDREEWQFQCKSPLCAG
jgi:hypothetical protein